MKNRISSIMDMSKKKAGFALLGLVLIITIFSSIIFAMSAINTNEHILPNPKTSEEALTVQKQMDVAYPDDYRNISVYDQNGQSSISQSSENTNPKNDVNKNAEEIENDLIRVIDSVSAEEIVPVGDRSRSSGDRPRSSGDKPRSSGDKPRSSGDRPRSSGTGFAGSYNRETGEGVIYGPGIDNILFEGKISEEELRDKTLYFSQTTEMAIPPELEPLMTENLNEAQQEILPAFTLEDDGLYRMDIVFSDGSKGVSVYDPVAGTISHTDEHGLIKGSRSVSSQKDVDAFVAQIRKNYIYNR